MSDKFWYYECRHGDDRRLYPGTEEGFRAARKVQDEDNGVTAEEILENGEYEVGGSYEEGHFWIDDGGNIELMEVEEL